MTYEQKATLIDDYAWGAKNDPHGYFKKLDQASLRLYERAKYDGFATFRGKKDKHYRHYWHWCEARNIPHISVWMGARYAKIEYNADPTGCPYSCNVSEAIWDDFRMLFQEHWVPENSSIGGGDHHMGAYGVPNAIAPDLARQLWKWVEPHCISAEARDKWLHEVWLTKIN